MRRLTILVATLALFYSGYWFIGSSAAERATREGFATMQNAGWDLSYTDLETRGFPSRFDTTVTDLDLTSFDERLSWQTPFVQVFALSYQPNNIIAAFPGEQSLRIGDQTLTIASDGLRASGKVDANANVSLNNVTAEVGVASVISDFGWSAHLDHALAALRPTGATNTYDLYVDVDQLTLPAEILALVDPNTLLSQSIEQIVFDSTVTLDRQLDRHILPALADNPPHVDTVKLNSVVVDWGTMTLSAEGELEIDNAGIPEGRITIKTAEWRQMIYLMANAGLIKQGIVPTVMSVAQTMAKGSETLDLPISFQGGLMSVGPIPLGAAPRLR